MGNFKSLALVALLLSLSLTVFADTSKDTTHAKDEVKSSEATDVIEPQPQAADTKAETKDVVAEPQQQIGFCRFGCCGTWFFGQCSFCCRRPQTVEAKKTNSVETNVVEPQAQAQAEAVEAVEPQRIGGCSFGCCGIFRFGRCSFCCARPQAEAEVIEPQQRGCRYGCCGSYANGQCSACCSKKMAAEQNRKNNEEVKP